MIIKPVPPSRRICNPTTEWSIGICDPEKKRYNRKAYEDSTPDKRESARPAKLNHNRCNNKILTYERSAVS